MKMQMAAKGVQSIWRGFWSQLKYQVDLLDIVSVQSIVRRRLATRRLGRWLRAASLIQVVWRRYHGRRLNTSRRLHQAAVVCQVR